MSGGLEVLEAKFFPDLRYGKMPKQHNYYIDQIDFDILTNQKSREKIFKAFKGSTWKLDFRIIAGDRATNKIKLPNKEILKTESKDPHSLVSVFSTPFDIKNRITVLFTHNVSVKNHMPMTACTLAHRLDHALCYTYVTSTNNSVMNARLEIWKLLVDIYATFSKDKCTFKTFINFDLNEPKYMVDLFTMLFTMKSARTKQLNGSGLEFVAELLAQYLISRRITFNPIEKWNFDINNSKFNWLDFNNINPKMNDKIKDTEQKINVAVHNMLDCCVGQIFTF